jgi:hypothetical protein
MKSYTVLYAEDVPHYATLEIEADDDAEAIERATANDFGDAALEPDWNSSVCRRIVHIEDGRGNTVLADFPLDDYRLSRASDSQAPGLINALKALREAIGGLPITIFKGPLYDALLAADRVLARVEGDAA